VYAVINKNNEVEIYVDDQLRKTVRVGLTYEKAFDYCRYQGLDIKPYARPSSRKISLESWFSAITEVDYTIPELQYFHKHKKQRNP
jgi:hypothetical protein